MTSPSNSAMTKEQLQTAIHNARGPLNVISMQAELIAMLIDATPENEKILQATQKIISQSKDCSMQLQDIFENFEVDSDSESDLE